MISKLLIANRGEIAIRISRAAAELGIASVAVFAEDDVDSLHVDKSDTALPLSGQGAAAYLDIDQLTAVARANNCDAVHPGYGFLSESAAFARACDDAGLRFVGPSAELLDLLGDKAEARRAAAAAGIAVLPGVDRVTSADEAAAFLESLGEGGAIMIKAVAGGGGRGIRAVSSAADVADAFERCASEAQAAFGRADLYVERLVRSARHIEVQVVADGARAIHLGERDCSIQRRNQKLIEIAPAPALNESVRAAIRDAAVTFASAVGYQNLGTFEFLLDLDASGEFAFIEANARLQVEHTVTEEVTGIDLVQTQLAIAGGETLADLGLTENVEPRGFAIQARVNMERMSEDGTTLPTGGTLTAFDPPTGPGVRTDTFGYAGYTTSPRYDSLLAKLIACKPRGSFAEAVTKTYRAACEFRIEGVQTNLPFLRNLLAHPAFAAMEVSTGFIDAHLGALLDEADHDLRHRVDAAANVSHAGVKVDANDPLAVLSYGQSTSAPAAGASAPGGVAVSGPEDSSALLAPLQGTIVSVEIAEGDTVRAQQVVVVMESMKMEHEIRAQVAGLVRSVAVAAGDTLYEGHPLVFIEASEVGGDATVEEESIDLDHIRPDLREVVDRHDMTLDAARPKAVERRRAKGQRTARENVDDLCDEGSFVEYGPLVIAAQRRRRSLEDLIENTPADGMITGVGSINRHLFDDPINRCAVMAYDYTVLAGTQGAQNHRKTDRLIDVAEKGQMPMVLFAEGGGGRPGDTDMVGGGGRTFARFAQLSGLVPMVGITSGRCFAGNASLLGCCDVIIATENANIGMGGPAMIEGGGLGVFAPEQIGPLEVQIANGVVDLAVRDEAHAVATAKQYLGYFQGRLETWEAPDQRRMRSIVPENRLRVYDIRQVIETLADEGSMLELRRGFGHGMVTALIRIEGRPVGVVANNPSHLGGAIDSDAADKGARFMQLCDAFDVPILNLCDTPGIMVGPEVEHTALVRHSSRMFVVGANLSVPFFTVVIRKAYGLGAIAMAGGSYKAPSFSVSWPTGEFGGMGLEGSVKLGFRKELAAIEDPQERLAAYEKMVARAYENGKALNNASMFNIDDTIDPADTRWWLANVLASIRIEPRRGKKRPAVDAW